jgi:hypothetical protein
VVDLPPLPRAADSTGWLPGTGPAFDVDLPSRERRRLFTIMNMSASRAGHRARFDRSRQ